MKHVEIGLTDKSDSARFAASWLAERGITGGLVLIGGDELGPVGGVVGSDSLLLVDALARAMVVSVGIEPEASPIGWRTWAVARLVSWSCSTGNSHAEPRTGCPRSTPTRPGSSRCPPNTAKERIAEALGTLGNGFAATRGTREEDGPGTSPLFFVSGVYTDDDHLLPGPNWTGLELLNGAGRSAERRLLDLRTGTLVRSGNVEDGAAVDALRLRRFATCHGLAGRGDRAANLEPGDPLRAPGSAADFEHEDRGEVRLARTGRTEGEIAVAARDRVGTASGRRVIERLATWDAPDRA